MMSIIFSDWRVFNKGSQVSDRDTPCFSVGSPHPVIYGDNMDKKIMIIALIAIVAIVLVAVVFVMPGSDGPDIMTFNGAEYTYEELEAEFGTEVVDGATGIPLGDIILSTHFADLDSDTQNETLFKVTADDGWEKHVSWTDIQSGILLEAEHMTYFPGLHSAYNVTNVVSIDDVDLGPLAIINPDERWSGSIETTWDELFAEIDEVSFTDNNQDMTGLSLIDVFNYTGFSDLENATITIEGVDGYSKTVTFTDIQTSYLLEEDMKSYFLDLGGQYRIRNIFRITVQY